MFTDTDLQAEFTRLYADAAKQLAETGSRVGIDAVHALTATCLARGISAKKVVAIRNAAGRNWDALNIYILRINSLLTAFCAVHNTRETAHQLACDLSELALVLERDGGRREWARFVVKRWIDAKEIV